MMNINGVKMKCFLFNFKLFTIRLLLHVPVLMIISGILVAIAEVINSSFNISFENSVPLIIYSATGLLMSAFVMTISYIYGLSTGMVLLYTVLSALLVLMEGLLANDIIQRYSSQSYMLPFIIIETVLLLNYITADVTMCAWLSRKKYKYRGHDQEFILNTMLDKKLCEYVVSPDAGSTVIIDGVWGSGKTKFIEAWMFIHSLQGNDYLKSKYAKRFIFNRGYSVDYRIYSIRKELYKYINEYSVLNYENMIKISLYGKQSLSEIKADICNHLSWSWMERSLTILSPLFGKIYNIKSSSLLNKNTDYFFNMEELISRIGKAIIIFDDIERYDGSLNEFFGLISYLSEQSNIKIILIINTEAWRRISRFHESDNNTSNEANTQVDASLANKANQALIYFEDFLDKGQAKNYPMDISHLSLIEIIINRVNIAFFDQYKISSIDENILNRLYQYQDGLFDYLDVELKSEKMPYEIVKQANIQFNQLKQQIRDLFCFPDFISELNNDINLSDLLLTVKPWITQCLKDLSEKHNSNFRVISRVYTEFVNLIYNRDLCLVAICKPLITDTFLVRDKGLSLDNSLSDNNHSTLYKAIEYDFIAQIVKEIDMADDFDTFTISHFNSLKLSQGPIVNAPTGEVKDFIKSINNTVAILYLINDDACIENQKFIENLGYMYFSLGSRYLEYSLNSKDFSSIVFIFVFYVYIVYNKVSKIIRRLKYLVEFSSDKNALIGLKLLYDSVCGINVNFVNNKQKANDYYGEYSIIHNSYKNLLLTINLPDSTFIKVVFGNIHGYVECLGFLTRKLKVHNKLFVFDNYNMYDKSLFFNIINAVYSDDSLDKFINDIFGLKNNELDVFKNFITTWYQCYFENYHRDVMNYAANVNPRSFNSIVDKEVIELTSFVDKLSSRVSNLKKEYGDLSLDKETIINQLLTKLNCLITDYKS